MAFRAMTDALMFRIRHLSGQQYINRYAPSKERYEITPETPLADRRTATDLLNA